MYSFDFFDLLSLEQVKVKISEYIQNILADLSWNKGSLNFIESDCG